MRDKPPAPQVVHEELKVTPQMAANLLRDCWHGSPPGANPQPVAKHVNALKAGTVLEGTVIFLHGMLYTGLLKLVSIRETGIAGRILFGHDGTLLTFLKDTQS